jgi:hypothetical protein
MRGERATHEGAVQGLQLAIVLTLVSQIKRLNDASILGKFGVRSANVNVIAQRAQAPVVGRALCADLGFVAIERTQFYDTGRKPSGRKVGLACHRPVVTDDRLFVAAQHLQRDAAIKVRLGIPRRDRHSAIEEC